MTTRSRLASLRDLQTHSSTYRVSLFEFFGKARWVSLPEESSHTPSRGDAEYSYECKANRMIDNCAFAPTLEHGDRSNDK
jgi:hypothetical protein